MIEIPCTITDPLGLHVQLAVLLASEAKRWRSRTTLEYHDNVIPAADLMQVMQVMLALVVEPAAGGASEA